MARLNNEAMARRDRFEAAMYQVKNAQMDTKHAKLRMRQALQRVPLDDLLAPGIEALDKADERLNNSYRSMNQIWIEGEADGWV